MLVFNHVGKGLDFREEPLRDDLVIPHRWDKTVSSVLSYTLKSRKLRKDCTVFMTFPYLFISRESAVMMYFFSSELWTGISNATPPVVYALNRPFDHT